MEVHHLSENYLCGSYLEENLFIITQNSDKPYLAYTHTHKHHLHKKQKHFLTTVSPANTVWDLKFKLYSFWSNNNKV